jgi:hypothetical protein
MAKGFFPFSSFSDVVDYAREHHAVEADDEESFAIRTPNGEEAVEIVTFESWGEPWLVFWCTLCDADELDPARAVTENVDLTFAMLAKDGEVFRLAWSCPMWWLNAERFDEVVARIVGETRELAERLELPPA